MNCDKRQDKWSSQDVDRADWFIKWTKEPAASETVHLGSFEEELGRIMYVAAALEYERPVSGPLYKFPCMHPPHSRTPSPSVDAQASRATDELDPLVSFWLWFHMDPWSCGLAVVCSGDPGARMARATALRS